MLGVAVKFNPTPHRIDPLRIVRRAVTMVMESSGCRAELRINCHFLTFRVESTP